MNTGTPVNPTQATDFPTQASDSPMQATDVLRVSTVPEHGVVVESPTPGYNTPKAAGGQGVGVEGEESVWVGRYSYKNYTLRILLRSAISLGWLALLWYLSTSPADTSSRDPDHWAWTWFVRLSIAGIFLLWLSLGWQIFVGRQGHRYELTTKRLFVDTGLFRRRRDQMELLKIQDIYIKQPNLFSRMLDIGTVVIETSEERLPIHYLAGVDRPTPLMDLIWHHARKERDLASVRVDHV